MKFVKVNTKVRLSDYISIICKTPVFFLQAPSKDKPEMSAGVKATSGIVVVLSLAVALATFFQWSSVAKVQQPDSLLFEFYLLYQLVGFASA